LGEHDKIFNEFPLFLLLLQGPSIRLLVLLLLLLRLLLLTID